jgi:hypothetical protein
MTFEEAAHHGKQSSQVNNPRVINAVHGIRYQVLLYLQNRPLWLAWVSDNNVCLAFRRNKTAVSSDNGSD